ncbi:MAG: 5'-methylthioadenosine/S-adenosylhomocysteine nucleosidase [Treponema sp.]|jgi:adenosylhomocysteine nucleosidase|nr:5'-methylthioadenosine/S-adenosylhomocysteine nucleosidase [Treponema sp.]
MIGIIGAMEDEITLLRRAIEDAGAANISGIEFYTGKLEGKDVALLRCGICKVNAAIGATLLIHTYRPELVINTGSAGGVDPTLHFGDAVIAEGMVQHDVDVTAFNYVLGQVPGGPPMYSAPEEIIRKAEEAVNQLKAEKILPSDFNHVRGIIASGDIFVHSREVFDHIRKNFPEARAVEMEGAAIAQTCAAFQVPSLIIRALSDVANSESPVDFSEFLPMASKHSAEIVRRIIKNL